MEHLLGPYKAHYKRHKSFNSFEGAVAHAVLYQLHYNHLKPHAAFDDRPPVPLKDQRSTPVVTGPSCFGGLLIKLPKPP